MKKTKIFLNMPGELPPSPEGPPSPPEKRIFYKKLVTVLSKTVEAAIGLMFYEDPEGNYRLKIGLLFKSGQRSDAPTQPTTPSSTQLIDGDDYQKWREHREKRRAASSKGGSETQKRRREGKSGPRPETPGSADTTSPPPTDESDEQEKPEN